MVLSCNVRLNLSSLFFAFADAENRTQVPGRVYVYVTMRVKLVSPNRGRWRFKGLVGLYRESLGRDEMGVGGVVMIVGWL
jgi:hypothetical protein